MEGVRRVRVLNCTCWHTGTSTHLERNAVSGLVLASIPVNTYTCSCMLHTAKAVYMYMYIHVWLNTRHVDLLYVHV